MLLKVVFRGVILLFIGFSAVVFASGDDEISEEKMGIREKVNLVLSLGHL